MEHVEDGEMRPEPISPEKREEIVAHMADGLLGDYKYFTEHREICTGTTLTSDFLAGALGGGVE